MGVLAVPNGNGMGSSKNLGTTKPMDVNGSLTMDANGEFSQLFIGLEISRIILNWAQFLGGNGWTYECRGMLSMFS